MCDYEACVYLASNKTKIFIEVYSVYVWLEETIQVYSAEDMIIFF